MTSTSRGGVAGSPSGGVISVRSSVRRRRPPCCGPQLPGGPEAALRVPRPSPVGPSGRPPSTMVPVLTGGLASAAAAEADLCGRPAGPALRALGAPGGPASAVRLAGRLGCDLERAAGAAIEVGASGHKPERVISTTGTTKTIAATYASDGKVSTVTVT